MGVIATTFRTHILAYVRGYKMVHEGAGSGKTHSHSTSWPKMVVWYAQKVALSTLYSKPDTLQKIVRIQKLVRKRFYQVRFKKVCVMMERDPVMNHMLEMRVLKPATIYSPST